MPKKRKTRFTYRKGGPRRLAKKTTVPSIRNPEEGVAESDTSFEDGDDPPSTTADDRPIIDATPEKKTVAGEAVEEENAERNRLPIDISDRVETLTKKDRAVYSQRSESPVDSVQQKAVTRDQLEETFKKKEGKRSLPVEDNDGGSSSLLRQLLMAPPPPLSKKPKVDVVQATTKEETSKKRDGKRDLSIKDEAVGSSLFSGQVMAPSLPKKAKIDVVQATTKEATLLRQLLMAPSLPKKPKVDVVQATTKEETFKKRDGKRDLSIKDEAVGSSLFSGQLMAPSLPKKAKIDVVQAPTKEATLFQQLLMASPPLSRKPVVPATTRSSVKKISSSRTSGIDVDDEPKIKILRVDMVRPADPLKTDIPSPIFPEVTIIHPQVYSDSDSSDDEWPRYQHDHRKSVDIIREQQTSINFFVDHNRQEQSKSKKHFERFLPEEIANLIEQLPAPSKTGNSLLPPQLSETREDAAIHPLNNQRSTSSSPVIIDLTEKIQVPPRERLGRFQRRNTTATTTDLDNRGHMFPVVEILHPTIYSDSESDDEEWPRFEHQHRKGAEIVEEQKRSINFFSIDIERELEVFREELENEKDDDNDPEDLEAIQFAHVVVKAVPIVIDERRREMLVNARDQDEFEQLVNDADIERLLANEGRQVPTYLQATRRQRRVEGCDVGQMNRICRHCGANYFPGEVSTRGVYTRCCNNGNVQLPRLSRHPEELERLFRNGHELSRQFKNNVIVYNNCFQFASIQANLRDIPGRGPYVYAIQGQIYHHITDINVNRPNFKCGPLYFLDPEEANRQRVHDARHFGVNDQLMRLLGDVLNRVNPFALQYRHLHQVYEEQRARQPDVLPRVGLEFVHRLRDPRQRELDMPEVAEVAAIYDFDENQGQQRNMRVFLTNQDGGTRIISHLSEHCDALSYPLLFPLGDLGWGLNIRHRNQREGGRNMVTPLEFYGYRLHNRFMYENNNNNFDIFRYAGKLTQRFIVDCYVKVEANNMHFYRLNQDQLRAEEYVGLRDYIHNRAVAENVPVGRMVILPSTFNTGPRSQMQRFQDAMAVVAKMGNPSLFITMTCNPRWPEIINSIPENDDPSNHPMIICRVFQLKLEQLIEELTVDHVMGVPVAHLYVIEFQKRGLPHAHILITLRNQDKPEDALKIDQIVSAELPDADTDPELFELVGRHMIHGPCGPHNPTSVCMEDGKCVKKFPKYWYNNTVIRNGRVNYRRRKNGRVIEIQRFGKTYRVANDFVVPYNPYLLLRYRTHINVEVCIGTGMLKYLFKYFFKTPDRADIKLTVEGQPQQRQQQDEAIVHDEITMFLNARYLTAPEGSWHMLKFNFHVSSHHVERLPVHLPGRQNVVFRQGQEEEAINDVRTTRLLQWFEKNRTDPEARRFLYTDFPVYYRWNRNRWTRRQRPSKPVVTRMYNVSLRNGELYYLRLLLLHVKGATSFEDLRTIDQEVCGTFQEACRRRNLLSEDREWVRSLTEASERAMPKQMRQMFAYILVFGIVEDPVSLWQQFKKFIFEDFTRRGLDEEAAELAALKKIQFILMVNGRRLSDFGLRDPPDYDPVIEADIFDVPEEQRRADALLAQLNQDQRRIFDDIVRAVDNDEEQHRLFFLQGAAGTGKTFLYNTIITFLNSRNVKIIPVAWTGLAAAILKQGRTVHSRFRLPLAIVENTTSNISFQSRDGQFIRESKLIIWDEISMTTKRALDIVEETLRFLSNDERPFGNKVVIVGGDFKQCLPIVLDSDRSSIVDACVKKSVHWPRFQRVELKVNMRVDADEERFVRFLDELGNGNLHADEAVPRRGNSNGAEPIQIPQECVTETLDELIQKVFGDLESGNVPNKAILTPLNETCSKINTTIVANMRDKPEFVYYSADCVVTDDPVEQDNYPMEFINKLTPSGFPPHRLCLKEGIVIMLLKNFNVRANLCNGTRLLVRKLDEHHIEAEQINFDGQLNGKTVFVPRVDFTSEGNRTLPFILRRRQFPVKPAYAITINKAQGQTFDTVGIYLPNPVFQHGQLYVAFSRAKRMTGVFVCVEEKTQQGKLVTGRNETYTINIVYDNVL